MWMLAAATGLHLKYPASTIISYLIIIIIHINIYYILILCLANLLCLLISDVILNVTR